MDTNMLIDILIGVVIFVALVPVILTSVNGFNWTAVNVGGTIYNFQWVSYVLILAIMLGLVYYALKFLKKKQ